MNPLRHPKDADPSKKNYLTTNSHPQHSHGILRNLVLSQVPARWLCCLRATPVKSIRFGSLRISKVLAPHLRWYRPNRHQRSLLHRSIQTTNSEYMFNTIHEPIPPVLFIKLKNASAKIHHKLRNMPNHSTSCF